MRHRFKGIPVVLEFLRDVNSQLIGHHLGGQIVDPNDQQPVFADPRRQDVIQLSTA